MESIKTTIINKTTDTNSLNPNKTTDTSSGYWVDNYIDNIFSDLCNSKYRAWYCRKFYKLGKSRVEAIAAQARKGNHPQRYFSVLLKGADSADQ